MDRDLIVGATALQIAAIGTAHARITFTADSLKSALERALESNVTARARSIATAVRIDGARAAAERLIRNS